MALGRDESNQGGVRFRQPQWEKIGVTCLFQQFGNGKEYLDIGERDVTVLTVAELLAIEKPTPGGGGVLSKRTGNAGRKTIEADAGKNEG